MSSANSIHQIEHFNHVVQQHLHENFYEYRRFQIMILIVFCISTSFGSESLISFHSFLFIQLRDKVWL